jgi:asparagine synthase (glutamine-hydrolysing)
VAWNGFVVGPRTAVQGIESLLPGELALYREDGSLVRSGAYWSLPPPGSGPEASEEELAAALEESVRLHLVSDVPLGVFLSGGIDSSAVANLARRAGRGPVHTFTLAFEEEEYNEGQVARAIAEAIGTEHQEVLLTEEGFLGQMEQALDSLDQPTFDGLNSYFMSRAVRDAGFTVALVGTGGDELFGGYTSFHDLPVLQRWARRLSWLPRAALVRTAELALMALQREQGAIPRQTRWAKLPEMVRRGDDLLALYQLAYALFLPEFQRQLLGPELAEALVDGLPAPFRARLETEVRGRSQLAAISVLEQRLFLGERLLRDNDAASMAASIEQRLPLVDRSLLETVLRLPDASRYEPVLRKAMLRRIGLRGLDPALFERPKRGFVLPYDRWIRQGLSGDVDRTLRDPQAVRAAGLQPEAVGRLWEAFRSGAPGLYWSRVWAIYILVRWCQRHGVRP